MNIPATTLHDHLHGKSKGVGAGAPTVLSPCEEQEIVLSCQVLAEMGFGSGSDCCRLYILENNTIKFPSLLESPGRIGGNGFLSGGHP